MATYVGLPALLIGFLFSCSDAGDGLSKAAGAVEAASKSAPPETWFEGGHVWKHEFGEREAGERLVWTARLRNIASMPVRVNKVHESCACHVVKHEAKWIKPGAYLELTLGMTVSRDVSGPFYAEFHLEGENESGIAGYLGTIELHAAGRPRPILSAWPPEIEAIAATDQSDRIWAGFDLTLFGPWGDIDETELHFDGPMAHGVEPRYRRLGAVIPGEMRWRVQLPFSRASIAGLGSTVVRIAASCAGYDAESVDVAVRFGEDEPPIAVFLGNIAAGTTISVRLPDAVDGPVDGGRWSCSGPLEFVELHTSRVLELRVGKLDGEGLAVWHGALLGGRDGGVNFDFRGVACVD